MSIPSLNNPYDGLQEQEDFFALARYYEDFFLQRCREQGVEGHRLGEDGAPQQEAIRFKSITSFGFSLDRIKNLNMGDESLDRYEYGVNFIGLLGSQGVLPQYYTKLALERIKHGDFALAEFIGLFEHRLISFYFRALGKYKLPIQYANNQGDRHDNYSRALKSFSGYYGHNPAQLYYAGHYARKNRTAVNLQSMLKELLNTEVHVESMVGRWLPIAQRDRCQIGPKGRGRNNRLGDGIILGGRYWDIQSTVTIQVHNLDMQRYESLQSDQAEYQLLVAAVSAYVPLHITVFFEFYVSCEHKQVYSLGQGLQLSNNAWLMSQPQSQLRAKRLMKRS